MTKLTDIKTNKPNRPQFDSETNNYYYRARYYNPAIGRFLQTDPVLYFDGMNVYTYCKNNPVVFVDVYGLLAGGIGGSLSGGAGGGGSAGFQFVFDSQGNYGVYIYAQGGGYCGAGGSATVDFSGYSSTTNNLNGMMASTGGSVGEGFTVGGEFNAGTSSIGGTVSLGLGGGPVPFELHGYGGGGGKCFL